MKNSNETKSSNETYNSFYDRPSVRFVNNEIMRIDQKYRSIILSLIGAMELIMKDISNPTEDQKKLADLYITMARNEIQGKTNTTPVHRDNRGINSFEVRNENTCKIMNNSNGE